MGRSFAENKYFSLILANLLHRALAGAPYFRLFLEVCGTAEMVRTLSGLHRLCSSLIIISVILEEYQTNHIRLILMLMEFSDNFRRSGLMNSLIPLSFQLLVFFLNYPFFVRVVTHIIYNFICREIHYKINMKDIRELMYEPLEGIYETKPTTHPFLPLKDSLIFGNKLLQNTSQLLQGDIISGRIRIQVKDTCPGALLPQSLRLPQKDHAIGCSLGVSFGLIPNRNGLMKFSAFNSRIAPERIKRTNPINDWIEAYLAGEMPRENPRYKHIENILQLIETESVDGIIATRTQLLQSLKAGTYNVDCSQGVVYSIEQLHKYKWNDFHTIYERHFKPAAKEALRFVKPLTIAQMLRQASCSRIRAKYEKEVKRRGLDENGLDSTFIMSLPEDGNADCIFQSSRAKTIPIFIKNEKYALKDQVFTSEFLDLCHDNGIYPSSYCAKEGELPKYSGFKPRIISAVPMGVPEEEVLGGQFLMCFYSASIKKATAEILEIPRVVEHSITMQKKKVVFHFVTNTRATPLDRPKVGKLWSSLLGDSINTSCIGKTTTEVLRKAYHSARIDRIINVLIHGDDSLMLYPIEGSELPLFIECDYSAYDTSQADDAISAEHQFYSDWFYGLPEGFLERSESHHRMPFSFKMGKEFQDSENDFLRVKVILNEAMRLSGGWNTTTGNSLVSAMIILYVIGSCRERDLLDFDISKDPLSIPRFNTYSDLRVKVKPEAFSYSFDPKHMSFLKMGIAEVADELVFVLLPSRCLRAFALLTLDLQSLGQDGIMENKLRSRVNEILFETFHGYTVQPDFPILGVLYSSIYWSIFSTKTALALKSMVNEKEHRYNEPRTILNNMKKGLTMMTNLAELASPLGTGKYGELLFRDMGWLKGLVHDRKKLSEENSYSPSSAYSGSFHADRQDIVDMVLTRYNGITSETGLIVSHPETLTEEDLVACELLLKPVDGLRTYLIEHAFFKRMAQKDYSLSQLYLSVPSWV